MCPKPVRCGQIVVYFPATEKYPPRFPVAGGLTSCRAAVAFRQFACWYARMALSRKRSGRIGGTGGAGPGQRFPLSCGLRPAGGNTSLRPIIAGSSYSSQDDLAANFGLGSASYGVAEVLWPGGVRNRLYGVWKGGPGW